MRMVHFVAAAAFLVACHGAAQAIPIGIVDAGFEDPPTSTSSIGAVSGWTISGSGAGVWNIGASPLGFWTVGATQGNQVAFVGREAPSGTPASIATEMPPLRAEIPEKRSDRARRDSVEANGRFINHLPGCRQGMILTPLAAWLLLPDSRAFGLETFWL